MTIFNRYWLLFVPDRTSKQYPRRKQIIEPGTIERFKPTYIININRRSGLIPALPKGKKGCTCIKRRKNPVNKSRAFLKYMGHLMFLFLLIQ
jgi:hypothetical protein